RALPITCAKRAWETELTVVHANGMRTDLAGAKASLEKLRPLVEQRLHSGHHAIAYAVAYNQMKGWLPSFYQVIKERLPMTASANLRIITGLDPVPESLRDALLDWAATRDLAAFMDDASLAKQVSLYRKHLRAGRKIVVIAHSEGNMYSNAAY